MEISKFFFKLYLLDVDNRPLNFLGTAFPIVPNGGLLTCRHVVDVSLKSGQWVGVLDAETNRFVKITQVSYSKIKDIDLAFLPNAFQREKAEYFPILTPNELIIGEDVYSFGFFAIGGGVTDIEQGYFSGKIINFTGTEAVASITLPYAVLEGMSGCPVLTYHNGPKLVGVAYGNRASRILASEVVEVEKDGKQSCETINRITEFGLAYHPSTLALFLHDLGVTNATITSECVQISNLS